MEQPEESLQPNQSGQWKVLLRDFVTIVVIAGVLVLILQAVVQKFIVDGHSMDNTLQNGQQFMVNKVVYNLHEPERGDIIVFHPPTEVDTDDYIKRIIGLPGETIFINEGTVYIIDTEGTVTELEEPYIELESNRSLAAVTIPEGEYFVMGDNRGNSADSRNGWTLERENIIGKAWVTIWPPSLWGLIPNHDYEEEIGQ
jgi:signal peptidase I